MGRVAIWIAWGIPTSNTHQGFKIRLAGLSDSQHSDDWLCDWYISLWAFGSTTWVHDYELARYLSGRVSSATLEKGEAGMRIFLILLLIVATHVHAENFTGQVVRIIDGDTVEILSDRNSVRVRLAGIDAPEKKQAYGEKSRQFLASLIFRKNVEVVSQGKDRYGRELGFIHLPDGTNVNLSMVKNGMAWVYRQYSKDAVFLQAEDHARQSKIGLWADSDPVAPWKFRRK